MIIGYKGLFRAKNDHLTVLRRLSLTTSITYLDIWNILVANLTCMGIRSWLKEHRFLSLGAGNEHRSDHIFHFFHQPIIHRKKIFLLGYKWNVEGKAPKNMIQKKLSHFFVWKGQKWGKLILLEVLFLQKQKKLQLYCKTVGTVNSGYCELPIS